MTPIFTGFISMALRRFRRSVAGAEACREGLAQALVDCFPHWAKIALPMHLSKLGFRL